MSEYTEKDLKTDIVKAAARIAPVTFDEIQARPVVDLDTEPPTSPNANATTTASDERNNRVVELVQIEDPPLRGRAQMANRLWLLGATAAAVVVVLVALNLTSGTDDGASTDESPPSSTATSSPTELDPVETPTTTAAPATVAPLELSAANAEIEVGSSPISGVEANGSVWIPNQGSGTVSRIDIETGEVTSIEVGRQPTMPIAEEGWIWVSLSGDNTIARIDTDTGEVVTIDVGDNPATPVADSENVWVPNGRSNTISRLAKTTGTVLATIETDEGPLTPVVAGDSIWVPNEASGTVTRILRENGEVVDTITTVGSHWATVVDDTIWIAQARSASLVPIDATTGELGAPAGGLGALTTAATVIDGDLWLAKTGLPDDPGARTDDAFVIVVDGVTGVVKAEIPVGASPSTPVFDGNAVWVANAISDTVSRIDITTREVVDTYTVGDTPGRPVVAGSSVWVPNQKSGTVSRIDID